MSPSYHSRTLSPLPLCGETLPILGIAVRPDLHPQGVHQVDGCIGESPPDSSNKDLVLSGQYPYSVQLRTTGEEGPGYHDPGLTGPRLFYKSDQKPPGPDDSPASLGGSH